MGKETKIVLPWSDVIAIDITTRLLLADGVSVRTRFHEARLEAEWIEREREREKRNDIFENLDVQQVSYVIFVCLFDLEKRRNRKTERVV